jgi:hypothetical protein
MRRSRNCNKLRGGKFVVVGDEVKIEPHICEKYENKLT